MGFYYYGFYRTFDIWQLFHPFLFVCIVTILCVSIVSCHRRRDKDIMNKTSFIHFLTDVIRLNKVAKIYIKFNLKKARSKNFFLNPSASLELRLQISGMRRTSRCVHLWSDQACYSLAFACGAKWNTTQHQRTRDKRGETRKKSWQKVVTGTNGDSSSFLPFMCELFIPHY